MFEWKQENEFGKHTDLKFNNPDFIKLADQLTPEHMIHWAARFRQHDKGETRLSVRDWTLLDIRNVLAQQYGSSGIKLNDEARVRFEYLTAEDQHERKVEEHKRILGIT